MAAALAAVSLAGCARFAPMVIPAEVHEEEVPTKLEVPRDLYQAKQLDIPKLVTEPEKPLAKVPAEKMSQIFDNAKRVAQTAPGVDTMNLSLTEARRQALENNLDLKVDLYNPAISEQGYRAELSKFEAVLGTTATYGKNYDVVGLPTVTKSVEPSVRIPLTTGGTASLNLPFSVSESKSFQFALPSLFPVPVGTTNSVGMNLALSQPLLRGAGTDVNTASIRVAKLQVSQADARTKLTAINVLANTETAYWQYYAADEDLKIQVRQYQLALDQLHNAEKLVKEGVRTQVAVIQAQSGVAQRLDAVISAENNRRRVERQLKRLINAAYLPVGSKTVIVPSTPPDPVQLIFNRDAVVRLAQENRMEMFQNEVQQAIDRINVKVNRNSLLPDVRFDFNYSFSGTQPRFEDAVNQMFKDQLNSYSLGLSLSVPLGGNQAARARLEDSILRQAQTYASQHVLMLSIQQDVLNAIDAVELNFQRILANRTAVALSRKTYEADRLQFQLGELTSTDVLRALQDLANAEVAQVQAISDYQTSLVDLAFATGTVLGQGGIVWSPLRDSSSQ